MQFVGSAFNDGVGEKMIAEFIRQYKPAYPMGWNTRVAVWSFVQYSVLSRKPLYVPHMVFIDRGGVIRAEYKGESEFFHNAGVSVRQELNKMLGTAAPAAKASKPVPKKK